jgi:hypothetical protein
MKIQSRASTSEGKTAADGVRVMIARTLADV